MSKESKIDNQSDMLAHESPKLTKPFFSYCIAFVNLEYFVAKSYKPSQLLCWDYE